MENSTNVVLLSGLAPGATGPLMSAEGPNQPTEPARYQVHQAGCSRSWTLCLDAGQLAAVSNKSFRQKTRNHCLHKTRSSAAKSVNQIINVCFVQSSVKHSAPTASVEMKSELCATRSLFKVED